MSELFGGIAYLLTPMPLMFAVIGTALGIVVGSIPGLTGAMLIALSLPLTFYMDSSHAIVLLVSMYMGAVSGGLISATLLRMPGTPAAVMTTFDAYPLAASGRPGRALGLGISASFIGSIFGWFALVLLAPPLTQVAVRFGPFEYFSMTAMALVLIASVSGPSMLKGIFSGALGALVSVPGIDPSIGQIRLTFGLPSMTAGFAVLPVLVGLFAFSQVLRDIVNVDAVPERNRQPLRELFPRLQDLLTQKWNLLRSALIGVWIGILPGIGPNISSVVAYTAAKRMSKTPEKFGSGSEEGIVAAECSNNASVGASLIPLVALGIPGSVICALLIGALVIHNIQPGPMMFVNNPDTVYAMLATVLISAVIMFVLMMVSIRGISLLMYIRKGFVAPAVLVFCVVGSFAYSNSQFDVYVMVGFGILGFLLEAARIPLGPFMIGFILFPLAEGRLRSGLMLTNGSIEPLFTRPISAAFLAVAVLVLIWPLIARIWRSTRRTSATD